MKEISVLRKEISICFDKESMYRGQLLGWIVADLIKIVTLIFVWVAVTKANHIVNADYVVTYYLLVMLISKLTSDYTLEIGSRDMVDGKFSNLLLRPSNYLIKYLAIDIGSNLLRIVLFSPVFVIGVCVAIYFDMWNYNFDLLRIALFILSAILAFMISFLLGNTVSLIALKIKEMNSIRVFFYNVAAMFSGEFVPILFLPSIWQTIFKVLPFRYTLSFPVEILLGDISGNFLYEGFLIALFWLVILVIIYKICFNYFIKYYESEGI